ncbi:MAG: M50 family metallopeptidase [Candidatus Velthaea sp.]|jgi:regulator of sigma E protease
MIALATLALPAAAFAAPSLAWVGKIVLFLIMISVLIVLHEGGHFLIARLNGVRVNDFALGMGPTLLKWTSPRSGTNYRLNLFPIGGYCAMQGEDGKSTEAEQQRDFRGTHADDPDNFQAKSPLQRLSIVVAGPIANFVLALAIAFGSAMIFGLPSNSAAPQIAQLQPGMPAAAVGLRVGDRIVRVNKTAITSGDMLVTLIHGSIGKPLHIIYERDGAPGAVDVTPVKRKDPSTGRMEGLIGFVPVAEFKRAGPIEAAQYAWEQFAGVISQTAVGLVALVVHPAANAGQMHGIIGIAQVAGAVQDFGWAPYLSLAASISISLGILNLLPFPALDGGRAAFIVVEMLRGRPVDPEKEAFVHLGGFAVLIALIVMVSYHDIVRIISGQGAF